MPSTWDTPTLTQRITQFRPNAAIAERNLHRRCEPLDRYRSGDLTADQFEVELRRRRQRWRQQADMPGCLLGLAIATVVLTLWVLATSGSLAWAMVGVVAAAMMFTHYRRLRRAHRAVHLSKCPDCQYPLTDLRHDAPSAGPAHCPECGADWPLVPPP
ncbi:MAG: hypothetical protein ACF8R7_16345 [Phycisphaerales bacterium JB039]